MTSWPVSWYSNVLTNMILLNRRSQLMCQPDQDQNELTFRKIALLIETISWFLTLVCQDIILVEALKLDNIKAGLYMLHCLPLRLVGSEGSPVRCILIKWSLPWCSFRSLRMHGAHWCYILANVLIQSISVTIKCRVSSCIYILILSPRYFQSATKM